MAPLGRLLFSRAWLFAIGFAVFAYSLHKVGASLGYYPRFFWFQLVTHFVSATAMALLLARFGLDTGLRGSRLVLFVVAFSAVGAVGWELTEYFNLWPNLNWWGIEDSLLDLAMDSLGVALVLVLLRTRLRPVIDPTRETPSLGELLAADSPGREADSR